MDYMKAVEKMKELRGETETLEGHRAATSFLLAHSFIQYLESDREYVYILMDKDGEGIVVRGQSGEIGYAKKLYAGAGWKDHSMNMYIDFFESNGFVRMESKKEWLSEGDDYIFLTIEAARALEDKAQVRFWDSLQLSAVDFLFPLYRLEWVIYSVRCSFFRIPPLPACSQTRD